MTAVAIYDDKCRACTSFSSLGRGITPLGYSTDEAKKLMTAQFGNDYGFILMLFTDDTVYWGKDAAAEISATGYTKVIRGVTHFFYPAAVKLMNVLLRRQRLPEAPKFKHKQLPPTGKMLLNKRAAALVKKIT